MELGGGGGRTKGEKGELEEGREGGGGEGEGEGEEDLLLATEGGELDADKGEAGAAGGAGDPEKRPRRATADDADDEKDDADDEGFVVGGSRRCKSLFRYRLLSA